MEATLVAQLTRIVSTFKSPFAHVNVGRDAAEHLVSFSGCNERFYNLVEPLPLLIRVNNLPGYSQGAADGRGLEKRRLFVGVDRRHSGGQGERGATRQVAEIEEQAGVNDGGRIALTPPM